MIRHILLFAFALTSMGVAAQHNDLKEIGFKGKVFSITAINYDSAKKTDQGWEPYDSLDFRNAMVYYFSEEGLMDSIDIIIRTKIPGREFIYSRIIYRHVGGRKAGYQYYDYTGVLAEEAEIVWKDSFTYTVTTRDLTGKQVSASETNLDKHYRESTSKIRQIRGDTISSYESSAHILDAYSLLKQTNYTDHKRNRNYTVTYTHQKIDDHGNPSETLAYNITDRKFKRFVVRRFVYY